MMILNLYLAQKKGPQGATIVLKPVSPLPFMHPLFLPNL
jgi:hypothetical protein